MAHAEVAAAEQLVLDPEQRAAFDGEVAAPGEAHRVAPGRPVERLGDRRPPVDHDRLGVLVGDRQAADVEALEARQRRRRRSVGVVDVPVDATEDERRLAEIEIGEPFEHGFVEGVALESGLERAAEIGLVEVTQTPRGRATLLEAVVGVVDVGLLVGEIRMVLSHRYL